MSTSKTRLLSPPPASVLGPKEAVPYLARALRVRPDDPSVRYEIAISQTGMGNLQEARKSLEVLVRDNPTFLDAHVSLARLYYRLHMKPEGDREKSDDR